MRSDKVLTIAGIAVTATVLLATLIAAFANRNTVAVKSAPAGVPTEVAFDGQLWTWGGAIRYSPSFVVYYGHEYRSQDTQLRLIDVSREQQFVRRLRNVQARKSNGEWINHGAAEVFLGDGSREAYRYDMDRMTGERVVYWKNGQLRLRDNWISGVQTGNARGYAENGKLEFDVEYENGRESHLLFSTRKTIARGAP